MIDPALSTTPQGFTVALYARTTAADARNFRVSRARVRARLRELGFIEEN